MKRAIAAILLGLATLTASTTPARAAHPARGWAAPAVVVVPEVTAAWAGCADDNRTVLTIRLLRLDTTGAYVPMAHPEAVVRVEYWFEERWNVVVATRIDEGRVVVPGRWFRWDAFVVMNGRRLTGPPLLLPTDVCVKLDTQDQPPLSPLKET